MKFLLDTDICVYLFTGRHPALSDRVRACDAGTLAFSTITLAELAIGSANGKLPSSAMLDAFSRDVVPVDFDAPAARAYAGLPFRRGRFDRLIAATALSLGLTLVTNNGSDFAYIPGLTVENWTT
ncbi:type II toxin-antitoxin system VapC family toxin [uncultured Sphingomonas sp.]|uniref:type II toxin-antitoxin system VapC family toxin n=1 Tax=uncultured Sphingomonas sp. TaxID=158754 RepID=UPI0035C9E384